MMPSPLLIKDLISPFGEITTSIRKKFFLGATCRLNVFLLSNRIDPC